MRSRLVLSLGSLLLLASACTNDNAGSAGLSTDVLVATWNLSRFPLTEESPSVVAKLIADRRLDLVAVQEIRDEAALDELVQQAPGYDGVLQPAGGTILEQRVGFVWRTSRLLVEDTAVLFPNDLDFPRPPLLARVRRVGAGTPEDAFTAIVVHLKAGVSESDVAQRKSAVMKLEAYVRDQVTGAGSAEVIVIGDFNTAPTDTGGPDVMAPFLGASTLYDVPTWSPTAPFSFIPAKIAIDHVVHTAALREERGDEKPTLERLDQTVPGYDMRVSDHLPVVLKFPFKKR